MQRVQHRQEEHAGAGDARGHVAEHEQLGPARAARAGSAAPAARRRWTATRASCGARRRPTSALRPRFSRPWVASRRRSWATTRCTAARSWAAPVGSARSSSRSGLAGGRDSVRSISARSSSRRMWRSNSRSRSRGTAVGIGQLGRRPLALAGPACGGCAARPRRSPPSPRPGGRRRRSRGGPGRAARPSAASRLAQRVADRARAARRGPSARRRRLRLGVVLA